MLNLCGDFPVFKNSKRKCEKKTIFSKILTKLWFFSNKPSSSFFDPKASSNYFHRKNNFSLLARVNDFLNSFSASASRLGRVKKFESATGLEVCFFRFFMLLFDVLSEITVVISSRSCKPLIMSNLKRVG